MNWLEEHGYEIVGEPVAIRVPTRVEVSAKMQMALNMNQYRNMHHHQLNKQKVNFDKIVGPQLEKLFPDQLDQIAIHYEVFAQNKGRLDTGNVASIVDKYFSDTMVGRNIIEDDDYTHIVHTSASCGGISPKDPHAIVTVMQVAKKEQEMPMRILLDQEEIDVAIKEYVENHVNMPVDEVVITSDENGLQVEIMVGSGEPGADKPEEKPKAPRKARGGRPRGSKNKPKEEAADAGGNSETGGDGDGKGAADAGGDEKPTATEAPDPIPLKPEAEAEATANAEAKSEKPTAGNLFGDDSQSPSSDNTSDAKAEAPTAEQEAPGDTAPKAKVSSIFDAD